MEVTEDRTVHYRDGKFEIEVYYVDGAATEICFWHNNTLMLRASMEELRGFTKLMGRVREDLSREAER